MFEENHLKNHLKPPDSPPPNPHPTPTLHHQATVVIARCELTSNPTAPHQARSSVPARAKALRTQLMLISWDSKS